MIRSITTGANSVKQRTSLIGRTAWSGTDTQFISCVIQLLLTSSRPTQNKLLAGFLDIATRARLGAIHRSMKTRYVQHWQRNDDEILSVTSETCRTTSAPVCQIVLTVPALPPISTAPRTRYCSRRKVETSRKPSTTLCSLTSFSRPVNITVSRNSLARPHRRGPYRAAASGDS
jgi:hypothetical protein